MQKVIERALNLLILLLESTRPVTAEKIRRTVPGYSDKSDDAFHRMFERDKDLLRGLGIPLQLQFLDAWEIEQGYSVDPDEYAFADPGLTDEERAALALAARIVRVGGSHIGVSGLHKLGGGERGSGFEAFGADLGAEADTLGTIFEAVRERRTLTFTYRETEGRKLDPYGVGYRRGHWYLVGRHDRGDRVYRVDRMRKVTTGEPGSFKRPRGFKVSDAFQDFPWETGGDETMTAVVRFDTDVAWWAGRTLGVEAPVDDVLETEVPVSNRDAFIGWLLGFGASAEVVEPAELREDIASRVLTTLEGANQ